MVGMKDIAAITTCVKKHMRITPEILRKLVEGLR